MKWPAQILIARHGQSERNILKDVAKDDPGRLLWCNDGIRDQDTPLTATGWTQVIHTGIKLDGIYNGVDAPIIDTVFVSPYLRTRQSTNGFVSQLLYKPKLVIEERIREIEFGMLDGLTTKGLAEKFPEEYARKQREGKYYYRPPGGESRPDVALRCHSFLDTLTRDYAGKIVLLATHSVVVLVLRRLLERWDEGKYLQVDKEEDVLNSSITTYECINDKITLKKFNQIYYS